jgi:hypothetical protein
MYKSKDFLARAGAIGVWLLYEGSHIRK